MALLWAHQYDQPPALTTKRPDIPDAVDAVLAKALSKSPDDRYDSCLAFVSALRIAARGPVTGGGGSLTDDEAAPGPPGPPPEPPAWARPVFRH
jgi:serine/threonine-protein kinase